MLSEPGNYTAEEVMVYQDAFRPVAGRYRRNQRIGAVAIACSFCLLIGSSLVNGFYLLLFDRPLFAPRAPWYVGAGGLLCLVIWGVAMISKPPLRCPASQGLVGAGISRFCPDCGAHPLDTDLLRRPHCPSCGWTMRLSKHGGRRYRIRACTGCGLLLDPRGL
jgi:hypothetical protein